MNKKSRLLPDLEQVYTRKRYYEAHIKKIHQLKKSIRTSRSLDHQFDDAWKKKIQIQQMQGMQVIKEIVTSKPSYQSPFQKRKDYDDKKENERLQNKIRCSISTIKRSEMENHSRLSQQIKSRICRFKQDSGSSRVLLKCQESLNILDKKEKKKFENVSSPLGRIFSAQNSSKYSNCLMKNRGSQSLAERQSTKQSNRINRITFDRNCKKIASHFEAESNFMRKKQIKIERLRSITSMRNKQCQKRVITEFSENQQLSSMSQEHCFTTQISEQIRQVHENLQKIGYGRQMGKKYSIRANLYKMA